MTERLRVNDRVRVVSGPFEGWIGKILELDASNERVKVVLQVFGQQKIMVFNQADVAPAQGST